MKKLNQNGFSPLGLIAVVVIIGLISAIGWLIYDRSKTANSKTDTSTVNNAEGDKSTTKTDPYEGWRTYSDPKNKISFRYPTEWKFGVSPVYGTEVPDTATAILTPPSGTFTLGYSNFMTSGPGLTCSGGSGSPAECSIVSQEELSIPSVPTHQVVKRIYKGSYDGEIWYVPALMVIPANSKEYTLGLSSPDADYSYFAKKTDQRSPMTSVDAAKAFYETEDAKTAIKILQSITKQ